MTAEKVAAPDSLICETEQNAAVHPPPGSSPQQHGPDLTCKLSSLSINSHLLEPFVPLCKPSHEAATEGTPKLQHQLNAAAAEFVPSSNAAPQGRQLPAGHKNGRARHWSNRWKGRDQQYGAAPGMQDWAAWSQLQHGQYEGQGFDVDAPNGHHSHAYGNGHVGSGSIGQAYADGAGYGYKDADGYALHNGQQYRQYDGQAYEGSTEDLYEQYEALYTNGAAAPGPHDAVYNSLFDDGASAAAHQAVHAGIGSEPLANGHHTGIIPQHAQELSVLPNGAHLGNGYAVSPMEAMMAVLSEQYPAYSQGSLREILDLRGGDIAGALDMLARNEAGALPRPDKAAATPQQKPPTLDDANFPSLGGSPSPTKLAASSSGGAAQAAGQAGGGFAAAVQKPGEAGARPSAGLTANGHHRAMNGHAKPAANHAKDGQNSAGSVPWVETGEAVATTYAQARQEASDQARMRNMCFQQATQAYLVGNKALAKELGAKGREHAQKMQAAHAVASEAIYRERNPHRHGGGQTGGLQLIDLHGLHAKEAVEVLKREVKGIRATRQASRQPGATVRVSVIVGTGHHTKGKHTPVKLPAAVQDWLEGEGISHKQTTPGLLDIAV